MKVVFFGSSKFVIPLLDALYYNHHEVTLIVTTEQGSLEPVILYANKKKINHISVKKPGDLVDNFDIHGSNAELGIVADFGIIIPQELLNFFTKGIINVHPSLLPKYRGPTPVQTALLNADKITGVTIIKVDKFMDHGPILLQKEEKIESTDTAKSLYEKLFKIGAEMLIETVNKFEHGGITEKTQDDNQATFTKLLTRENGYFDYKLNPNPEYILNMIKAYYPWPGVWTKTKVNQNDERIVKLLPNQMLQVEGGREMKYADFINGYPLADKQFLEFLRKGISGGTN